MVVTLDKIKKKMDEGKLVLPYIHKSSDIQEIKTNEGTYYGLQINKSLSYPVYCGLCESKGIYELHIFELWDGYTNANYKAGVIMKNYKYKGVMFDV